MGCDIVYGVRDNRDSDSAFKRASGHGYYRLLREMAIEAVMNHANYRLMSRRAIETLRGYREVNLYLRGIIPMLRFTSTTIAYTRAPRFAGKTKYLLRKMLKLALDGITSFATSQSFSPLTPSRRTRVAEKSRT
jgi:hypothetical protein